MRSLSSAQVFKCLSTLWRMVRHQVAVFCCISTWHSWVNLNFHCKCGITTMGAAWGKILILIFLYGQSKGKTVPVHVTKVCEKMKVWLCSFLSRQWMGDLCSASQVDRFNPGETAFILIALLGGRTWWASEPVWTLWRRKEFLTSAGDRTTVPCFLILHT